MVIATYLVSVRKRHVLSFRRSCPVTIKYINVDRLGFCAGISWFYAQDSGIPLRSNRNDCFLGQTLIILPL